MQFAIWLVGLMCHLSALVRETLQHRLHPKQESFIKQLSSYEIITPLRVNDFGESFPHKLHYRRRRRSLNDDLSGLRVHYRIDAFGERFHLNLTADSGFIAPSYTVTHLGVEQSNGTDIPFNDPSEMRHCFFRGHVNAKSEFPAVFSMCTGLVGTFTTQYGEYFMEPLLNAEGEEYDEEHNKPHLVYRQERKNISHTHNNTEPCAASEIATEMRVAADRGRFFSRQLSPLFSEMWRQARDGGKGSWSGFRWCGAPECQIAPKGLGLLYAPVPPGQTEPPPFQE
ncbi:hypothetical protein JOQ06_002229, partial [Pogonophryne albipinna]